MSWYRNKKNPPLDSDGSGATCVYCERALEPAGSYSPLAATRDHVIPKSRGGRLLVWACYQCNHIKGDMTPFAWKRFMQTKPRWWTRPELQRPNIGPRKPSETFDQVVARHAKCTDPRVLVSGDYRDTRPRSDKNVARTRYLR